MESWLTFRIRQRKVLRTAVTIRDESCSHDCIDLSIRKPTPHPDKEKTHQTKAYLDIFYAEYLLLCFLILALERLHLLLHIRYICLFLSSRTLRSSIVNQTLSASSSSCLPPTAPNRSNRSNSFRTSQKQRIA